MEEKKDFFMNLAQEEAQKSRCLRRKVGAVLVKDGQVIAAGHNGPLSNFIDCQKEGCIREKLNIPSGERNDVCYGVCAEQKVLLECAGKGKSCEGAVIYTTWQPCSICVKAAVAAGIKKVVFLKTRDDQFSNELLKKSEL